MQNTPEEHKLLLWCEINVRWKNECVLNIHNDNSTNHTVESFLEPYLLEQTIEITSVLVYCSNDMELLKNCQRAAYKTLCPHHQRS